MLPPADPASHQRIGPPLPLKQTVAVSSTVSSGYPSASTAMGKVTRCMRPGVVRPEDVFDRGHASTRTGQVADPQVPARMDDAPPPKEPGSLFSARPHRKYRPLWSPIITRLIVS